MGVCSLDSGDIREGNESGDGKRSQSEVREERGGKGEEREGRAAAAAEAMLWRSRGVIVTGVDLPGLFRW